MSSPAGRTWRDRCSACVAACSVLAVLVGVLGATPGASAATPPPGLPVTGAVTGVHDPVVAEEDGVFWMFSTGLDLPVRRSTDLVDWQAAGSVFPPGTAPAWWPTAVPGHGGRDVWAPDVTFFGGRWHLYYAISIFGFQQAAIGHASSATLDPTDPTYGWTDHGPVVASTSGDAWTAIDPALVLDGDGTPWLAWGSYWGGIWMRQVDPSTGELTGGPAVNVARRATFDLTEAPYFANRDGWWYLFTSWNQCCAGVDSTYEIRVGRAPTVTGPYVDADGRPLLEGGGTRVLSRQGDMIGPGHNAVLRVGADWRLVHHYYDGATGGTRTLAIQDLVWDAAGWPSVPGFVPDLPTPPATPIGVNECRPTGPMIESGTSLISAPAHLQAVEQPTLIRPPLEVTGPASVPVGGALELGATATLDLAAMAQRVLEDRVRPFIEAAYGPDLAAAAWVRLSIADAATTLPLPAGTAPGPEPETSGGVLARWRTGGLEVTFPGGTADTRNPAPPSGGTVRWSVTDAVGTAPRTIDQHLGGLTFGLSLTIGVSFLGEEITGTVAGPWECALSPEPVVQTAVLGTAATTQVPGPPTLPPSTTAAPAAQPSTRPAFTG